MAPFLRGNILCGALAWALIWIEVARSFGLRFKQISFPCYTWLLVRPEPRKPTQRYAKSNNHQAWRQHPVQGCNFVALLIVFGMMPITQRLKIKTVCGTVEDTRTPAEPGEVNTGREEALIWDLCVSSSNILTVNLSDALKQRAITCSGQFTRTHQSESYAPNQISYIYLLYVQYVDTAVEEIFRFFITFTKRRFLIPHLTYTCKQDCQQQNNYSECLL